MRCWFSDGKRATFPSRAPRHIKIEGWPSTVLALSFPLITLWVTPNTIDSTMTYTVSNDVETLATERGGGGGAREIFLIFLNGAVALKREMM